MHPAQQTNYFPFPSRGLHKIKAFSSKIAIKAILSSAFLEVMAKIRDLEELKYAKKAVLGFFT